MKLITGIDSEERNTLNYLTDKQSTGLFSAIGIAKKYGEDDVLGMHLFWKDRAYWKPKYCEGFLPLEKYRDASGRQESGCECTGNCRVSLECQQLAHEQGSKEMLSEKVSL